MFLLADDFISNHSIWKNYVSNNCDPDQSDCPDILSGLIWVQTVYNFSWSSVQFTKTTFLRLKHSPQLWEVE